MSRSDQEWVAWTREHRVAYELAPLVEQEEGRAQVQSGFTLTFYAAVPMDEPAGEVRQEAGRRLLDELRALAEAVVLPAERKAQVELDPPHTALLRPENEFKPEIGLTCRIFHPGEPAPVTAEDRSRLTAVEKRLAALGLKRGCW